MLNLSPRDNRKPREMSKFDLENEGQGRGVEERNLRHSIGNVRINIGELFHNFGYLGTYVYLTSIHTNTHNELHGPDYRPNLQKRFAYY